MKISLGRSFFNIECETEDEPKLKDIVQKLSPIINEIISSGGLRTETNEYILALTCINLYDKITEIEQKNSSLKSLLQAAEDNISHYKQESLFAQQSQNLTPNKSEELFTAKEVEAIVLNLLSNIRQSLQQGDENTLL